MSRRGRSGPTISLFSFQDIITSVTAIVTVIALLLALDLVIRKQSKSNHSSADLAAALRNRLEQVEAELSQLQTSSDMTDQLVQEVAATSPNDLRNEIGTHENAIKELTREKRKLEEQNRHLKEREKEKLAEQFDLEPLKEEQARTSRAAADVEEQQTEELSENRRIFTLPKGYHKEGWLAVIEAQKISVAPFGRATAPIVFTPTGGSLFGSSVANNLEKWIKEKQLQSAYFLVLIRPGANATFDSVEDIFDSKSISYGFDLIGAEQSILHPERGAAP